MKYILSILILNYKSAEETISLYKEVKELKNEEFRILVIDNASGENEECKLRKEILNEDLKILNKNLGYAGGNNVGIQEAIAMNIPYVLLLNPDIRLHENCVDTLLKTIREDTELAAVGPRICFRDNAKLIYSDGGMVDKEQGFFTYHLNNKKIMKDIRMENKIKHVDYVNGSVFLARTAVFERIGYMLEDFFLYFEETEWCLRAKGFGYNLVTNSEALAFHLSSPKGVLFYYYITRNRLLLSKIYPEYYKKTEAIIRRQLFREVKRNVKKFKLPGDKLKAKLRGYFAGRAQSIIK